MAPGPDCAAATGKVHFERCQAADALPARMAFLDLLVGDERVTGGIRRLRRRHAGQEALRDLVDSRLDALQDARLAGAQCSSMLVFDAMLARLAERSDAERRPCVFKVGGGKAPGPVDVCLRYILSHRWLIACGWR